jgi:acyl carrier protein
MTSDQVVEQIKRIVVEDLDVSLTYEELDETVPLFEEGLGLDSVALVELISFIEKRFGIELQDDLLTAEAFQNLRSVAALIGEQLAQQQRQQA